MEFEILGWPEDGPALTLDHRVFSYAGKFVMTTTGKAVFREDDTIVAAASFSEDRTDPSTIWLRYLTVHNAHQGAGIGSKLAYSCRTRMEEHGYENVNIAVNNVYAFEAAAKAGFGYTGRTTGIAELVLSTSVPIGKNYRQALELFDERATLDDEEREFISSRISRGPPDQLSEPVW